MIAQNINASFRPGHPEMRENDVLHVRQINMHHAKKSTELLNIWLLENAAPKKGKNKSTFSDLKIALIQEPYLGTSNTHYVPGIAIFGIKSVSPERFE